MQIVRTPWAYVALMICIAVATHAGAAPPKISDGELAALREKPPAEKAQVFIFGDLAHARAAAEYFVRDWDTLRANYDLLMQAIVKAADTMEPCTELSLHHPFTIEPEGKEAPRSLLLLASMPAIIREAPLGAERDKVADRFLSFLEKELADPASRFPGRILLASLTDTVFSGGPIVPERNAERVTKHLMAHADDSDLRVVESALRLLLRVAPSQEKEVRTRTLEFVKAGWKKAGFSGNLGWQFELLERDVTGESQWPIEVIGERECRDMLEASTDDLINAFLGKSLLKSHRALEVLTQREETQARVLGFIESHPDRFPDVMAAYGHPLPETATDAEKRRRDQLIDFLQTILNRPDAKVQNGPQLRLKVEAVDALSRMLGRGGRGSGFGESPKDEPQRYASERMLGLMLTALDDPDWQVRNRAANRLGAIVQGDSDIAAKIMPDLEERAAQLEAQYGYGKESRATEEKRLLKEFHETPKEWEQYKSITSALERARNAR